MTPFVQKQRELEAIYKARGRVIHVSCNAVFNGAGMCIGKFNQRQYFREEPKLPKGKLVKKMIKKLKRDVRYGKDTV